METVDSDTFKIHRLETKNLKYNETVLKVSRNFQKNMKHNMVHRYLFKIGIRHSHFFDSGTRQSYTENVNRLETQFLSYFVFIGAMLEFVENEDRYSEYIEETNQHSSQK